MMTDAIEALNEFEVVQKPAVFQKGSELYQKISLACSKLGNDQSLSIPLSKFESKHCRISMENIEKKMGIRIQSTIKGANVLVWKK